MKKAVMTGNLLEIFFTVLGFIVAVLYSLPFFKWSSLKDNYL